MDEHRFCPICNHPTDGSCGHVRPRLPLVLLAIGVLLLLIPLAYGAVSNRRTAAAADAQGAKAASGRQAGEANPAYPLRPAHALSEVDSAAAPVDPQEVREGQEDEPIAYVGHGGFFDQNGDQIAPTVEWVAQTQSWYRKRLLAGLEPNQQAELVAFERRLAEGLTPEGQAGLVVQQRSLDWLAARSPHTKAMERTRSKVNALKYRLSWRLPHRNDREQLQGLVPFELDTKIESRLGLAEFKVGGGPAALVTTNSGQAYINECMAADVPIPPSIGVLDPAGTAGWRSLGFIPTTEQFINQGMGPSPAEVRVFESPKGMCIALPRYTNTSKTTVVLDGVICLSKLSSKVCFWDNQRMQSGFSFPTGTVIPIGVPTVPGGLYQAGGAELEGGSGGICTDCHAGENPYIIHPLSDLDPGAGTLLMGDLGDPPLNLPTFAPNRYIPLVPTSWPQNELSHAEAFVPGACVGCHRKPVAGGIAGRFPHLSVDLNGTSGYCRTILRQAILRTMPPSSPGSESGTTAVVDFQNWCKELPTTSPSDNGDPHLTTTNGVRYDFQAAGEFTALRNSDTGFELQTRQTPVLTSFTPGANPYTGLASCVSLNTAAAFRVGRHRISYQPGPGTQGERMQLRIDGKPVVLPKNGLKLGGGNRIAKAALGGGLDIRLDDGTRVIITPNFWASEGYWHLDIEVLNTPAREGTMGHILGGNWLPLAPNGSSFGPKPAALAARHLVLNRAFANAWRVTNATSLFDYAPGTSTASFTERSWPPPPGATCATIRSNPWPGGKPRKPVKPMNPEEAQKLCRRIQDPATFENCVFDLTATGNPALVDAYLLTLKVRTLP